MAGSNPKSNVHVGASMTPSRLMNSWTLMVPIAPPRVVGSSVDMVPVPPAPTLSTNGTARHRQHGRHFFVLVPVAATVGAYGRRVAAQWLRARPTAHQAATTPKAKG